MNRTTRTRLVALAAAGTLAVGLGGCGSGGSHGGHQVSGAATPTGSTADHDQADVMFSAMMVPHHRQAIEMADLVPDRTSTAEVRDLAERIRGAQQPEVDTMTAWLTAWGTAPMADHEMGGHGMDGMDGMMTADDLAELEGLRDTAFDRRWLEMMVEHHEGAVTMAEAVLRDGTHAGTRALAQAVISAQREEIAEMKALLAR